MDVEGVHRPTSLLRRFITWLTLPVRSSRSALTFVPAAGSLVLTSRSRDAGLPPPQWRDMMVFRKESRADSFQRQISALRQQLGSDQEDDELYPPIDDATPMSYSSVDADETTTTRPAAAPPAIDGDVGVIAANSHWNGTLRSEGSLHVLGRVEGELHAADEIYVAEGAHVTARVSADRVTIAGTVDGTVECMRRLEVLPSGHVIGDVTSPTLIVHEGATVEGDLTMRAPAARQS